LWRKAKETQQKQQKPKNQKNKKLGRKTIAKEGCEGRLWTRQLERKVVEEGNCGGKLLLYTCHLIWDGICLVWCLKDLDLGSLGATNLHANSALWVDVLLLLLVGLSVEDLGLETYMIQRVESKGIGLLGLLVGMNTWVWMLLYVAFRQWEFREFRVTLMVVIGETFFLE
jgi:hypothetical protein